MQAIPDCVAPYLSVERQNVKHFPAQPHDGVKNLQHILPQGRVLRI